MSDPDSLTILVVDDEPMVRSFMAEVLRRAGYSVIEAADAEAGWDIASRQPPAVDAIVTDVRLPGMSGPALLRRVRQQRPGIPALYVTGYAGDEVLDPGSGDDVPCLPKPFRTGDLLESVQRMLVSRGITPGSMPPPFAEANTPIPGSAPPA